MSSSEIWSCVAPVRTEVSEERIVSIIRLIRIGDPVTTLTVTSNWGSLRRNHHPLLVTANVVPSSPILVTPLTEEISPSETSTLVKATGVTSQKTAFFTFRAVKTWNLIRIVLLLPRLEPRHCSLVTLHSVVDVYNKDKATDIIDCCLCEANAIFKRLNCISWLADLSTDFVPFIVPKECLFNLHVKSNVSNASG
jgi:hypothetical protein